MDRPTFPILTKLGGPEAAFEKIVELGFANSFASVRMWHVRRRLPGDAIVLLREAAESERVEVRARDLAWPPDMTGPSKAPANDIAHDSPPGSESLSVTNPGLQPVNVHDKTVTGKEMPQTAANPTPSGVNEIQT